ncbi:MAG: ATP-dependent zinc metalloprotease FtsH [Candidatus Ancillula trichonymphae]|jgi:cell division protease FtsH|nr:ATP-dependent zinc metalloprotease FtsH [Candidatus Ancillula trichonymphae]
MGKVAKSKQRKKVTWIVVSLVIILLSMWYFSTPRPSKIDTSDGIALLSGTSVKSVVITEYEQKVELKLTENFKKRESGGLAIDNDDVVFYYIAAQTDDIWHIIRDKSYSEGYDSLVPQDSILRTLLSMLLPALLLVGVFFVLTNKMQGGSSGGPFGVGKARMKRVGGDGQTPDMTFEKVAGVVEAIDELKEIRDFMAEPKKFKKFGAKIPKGVLLYGPPGTGKTLLARAVAGEAKVPFFSISGSDFIEMFVGVGASRVRDLFARTKAVAPSIVFIDEVDAVGRARGMGTGSHDDERGQTLNQVLVEMDGFDGDTNVLIIAATNRPEVLDPALLRPGRFDRQISVDAPDLLGREAILKIHAEGKPFAAEVDLHQVAKRTPGYTGADLANVLNEAALLAARGEKEQIGTDELDEAIDRVMAGPQRRSRKMNEKDLRNTAYHEAGHAIVAAAMHYTDPVNKITILPRGRALGYTSVMPTEDRYSVTRNQLLDQMAYAMGGRVAEEVVFQDPSTGASNDIAKATSIAKNMVTLYGMSSKIGPVKVAPDENDALIGGVRTENYKQSAAVENEIGEEIRKLLSQAQKEARIVIDENRTVLDTLADKLLENETLLENELNEFFKPLKRWGERPVWNSQEQMLVTG